MALKNIVQMKKDKKGIAHMKKLKKDIKDGSEKLKVGNYAVNITYNYLLKAQDQTEAISKAMDRLLGRRFNEVYFNGMTTKAELTKELPPTFDHIKLEGLKDMRDFKNFQVKRITDGGTQYGIKLSGDRKDSKEQDYVHFDSID